MLKKWLVSIRMLRLPCCTQKIILVVEFQFILADRTLSNFYKLKTSKTCRKIFLKNGKLWRVKTIVIHYALQSICSVNFVEPCRLWKTNMWYHQDFLKISLNTIEFLNILWKEFCCMAVTQRHLTLLQNNHNRRLPKAFQSLEEKQKIIWQKKLVFPWFL